MFSATKYLLVIFGLMSLAEANQLIRIGEDVELPIPNNWYLATDTLALPIQLVYYNDSAEILIFRSEIGEADAITSESELRQAVDLVVDDVIDSLPDGLLHTSTGFYENYRTGFILEFGSSDSITGTLLENSLKGILYRHPDDSQILFTIWGKAAATTFPQVKDAISMVQSGFAYRGEFEPEVFAPTAMTYWPLILVGVAFISLMLLRPRKRPASRRHSPDSPQ